jgi:prepilin-type N-terminal cleavage/methylation domain-containing protein
VTGSVGQDRNAGLTLLELLVAVSILALLSPLLYGTFSRTLASRNYATARAAAFSTARAAMDWLERDLAGSFVVGSYPAAVKYFFSTGAADEPAGNEEPYLLDVTAASALGTSLLVRPEAIAVPGPSRPDQAHVIYRLEEQEDDEVTGDDGGTIAAASLVRYDFRPAFGGELEDASRAVIARNVESIQLRFYDGTTWFESWDSEAIGIQHDRAPLLVEVRMTIVAAEGDPLEFVSAVTLPMGGRRDG